jgi:Ca-activated chloride channel family protein
MKFGSLSYLYLMWCLAGIIVFYVYVQKRNKRLLALWGDLPLVNKLITNVSFTKRKIKTILIITGVFFIILALAQPQWGYHWEELKRKGIDIIVCLDTSKSMLADDIKPTRFAGAKLEIEDLLKVINGDRIGLVAFAGTSFLQCPLTLDYGAFRLFLENIDTDIIPQPGTDIGGAIQKALNAFGKESKKHRAIILITDGEDHSGALEKAAESAKNMGVPVYIVGMGSAEGTPIAIVDEKGNRTYLKDKKGSIVLSKLDSNSLKKAALTSAGAYIEGGFGAIALDKIYTERISKIEKQELESSKRKIYENRFQIALGIALLLLFIEGFLTERKK